MKRRSFLISVCAAALLAGCTPPGGDGVASTEPAPVTASPTTTTVVKLPAGTWWVDVPGVDAKFAVPTTWRQYSPEKLLGTAEADLPFEVRELAASMGMSGAKMLEQFAAQAKVICIDPVTKANMYLQVHPGATAVDEPSLSSTVKDMGGEAGKAEQVDTPLGEAMSLPYTLTFGASETAGRIMSVKGPEAVLVVTVSSREAAVADSAAKTILATVSPRDK